MRHHVDIATMEKTWALQFEPISRSAGGRNPFRLRERTQFVVGALYHAGGTVVQPAGSPPCASRTHPFTLRMRVLFLENHDSFSWNLIDILPVAREDITMASVKLPHGVGCESDHPVIARSGVFDATKQSRFLSGNPPPTVCPQIAPSDYDCLIIGPGPTDPIRAGIIDIVNEAARLHLPTLGICLGYQAIGLAFGAKLVRTEPCHGTRSQVTFHQSRMFPGVNGAHTVMRYHSLSLTDITSPLRVIAHSENGIPMAIEHESLPIAGLQFHPDSYATDRGREMVTAFFQGIE